MALSALLHLVVVVANLAWCPDPTLAHFRTLGSGAVQAKDGYVFGPLLMTCQCECEFHRSDMDRLPDIHP